MKLFPYIIRLERSSLLASSDSFSINGVSLLEGCQCYENVLTKLFNDFVEESFGFTEGKINIFLVLLMEKKEDVEASLSISEKALEGLRSYCKSSLVRDEIKKAMFEREMYSVQLDYMCKVERYLKLHLNQCCNFEKFIPLDIKDEKTKYVVNDDFIKVGELVECKSQSEHDTVNLDTIEVDSKEAGTIQCMKTEKDENPNIIKGIRGFAAYLNCGVNKAQAIVSNGILKDYGIQYYAGGWCFNLIALGELLKTQPELFRNIKCKR